MRGWEGVKEVELLGCPVLDDNTVAEEVAE